MGFSVRVRLATAALAVMLGVPLVAACASPAPSAGSASTPRQTLSETARASGTASVPASPTPASSSRALSSPPASLPVTPTPVPAASGGLVGRIRDALTRATAGVVLDLAPDTGDGSAQLDGTADDGQGPGRLLVAVTPAGSTAVGNLCLDREFVQGGRCERVPLPGGDLLYRRGLVVSHGTATVVVAIHRADGTGILLESGNFRVEAPPVLVGGQPRPAPIVTRDDPVFTLDELQTLAEGISAATRGCTPAACP